MIWGITLEPGQAHTEVIEDEVHLSMATMESRGCIGSKADNFSHVVIKTGTTEYLLCTLVNGITYQQCLDLKLMPSDKVTFSVQGTNVVYLTGYSFASSETDQEITQTEDWIEDPVLEEGIPQDNVEYSEGDSSFQPSVGHDVIQGQQQNTADEEDQEQFSLQYEVPATEQQYQYTPERGQQISQGAPSSSHQRQLQQHPSHDTGESNLDIKEEIHTVVDTDEDVPTDQANEGVSSQSIHQPSTSAGESYSEEQMATSMPFPYRSIASMNSDIWKSGAGSVSPKHHKTLASQNRDTASVVTMAPREVTGHSTRQSLHRNTSITQGENQGTSADHVVRGQKRSLPQQFIYQRSNDRTARSDGNKNSAQSQKQFIFSDGERPYHCRYCGRGFRLPTYVRAHERIHTGEKPYTCKFCPRTFRIPDHVKKHERTHTGERPYGCESCPKRFKQLSHLREHEKTHRKGRRW